METNLHFVASLVDGGHVTQDFTVPTDKVDAAIPQLLSQYAQVGMLKRDGNKYTLIPHSQIRLIECEIPSLVVATSSDTQKAAVAAGGLKKLTLVKG